MRWLRRHPPGPREEEWMFKNADEVLRYIKDEDVKFVDVRFCDLPGVMQHFNVPVDVRRRVDFFTDGQMFDGSSIRGFQAIHESDMKLDPRRHDRLHRPVPRREDADHQLLDRRPVHRRALQPRPAQHRGQGRGLPQVHRHRRHRVLRPEAEFYIFDDVRFETKQNAGYYYIDSVEGAWNTGRDEEGGNRGYKTRYKGGYFPVPPVDHFADLRDEMVIEPRGRRPPGRARAPRGRHRRPGRDQLPLRHAAARPPTT